MESDTGRPTPTTPTENSTSNTRSRSSFFRNRFSNASLLSIRTLLPQYSAVDSLEDPTGTSLSDSPVFPLSPSSWSSPTGGSDISPQSPVEPPRYSLLNPPNSLAMTWRASIASRSDIEGEFRYSYPIRGKKPWATLHLHTRDAVPGNIRPLASQPRVPRFWSCDPIRGRLDLDLDSAQNIQQISILINGNVVVAAHSEGSLPFLAHEYIIWDKSMGDPHLFNEPYRSDMRKKKFDGRFAPGQYSFPFSFLPVPMSKSPTSNTSATSPFPPLAAGTIGNTPASPTFPLHHYIQRTPEKQRRFTLTSPFTVSGGSPSGTDEAVASSSQMEKSCRSPTSSSTTFLPGDHHIALASPLPQSFLEKGIKSNVAYDLSVCVVHGRFKPNSRINTNIVYTPALHPHPMPRKRREAYEANALLPSPMDGPEGWLAWPTLTIYGNVNPGVRPRHTKAECKLYLSQPLSYTRGSVIPCFLTICSDDKELVHLLSNPKTPILRLLRCIHHPMADDESGEHQRTSRLGVFSGGGMTPGIIMAPNGEMKSVNHEVGRTQWWIPSKDVVQNPNVRHLGGEIHLSPTLQPTCDLQLFRIEYSVQLMSFRTEKFEPESHPSSRDKSLDNVLASSPVEITTLYREDEPIPTAYSEPPKSIIMRQVDGSLEGDKDANEVSIE